jgi:hypothetical protein
VRFELELAEKFPGGRVHHSDREVMDYREGQVRKWVRPNADVVGLAVQAVARARIVDPVLSLGLSGSFFKGPGSAFGRTE